MHETRPSTFDRNPELQLDAFSAAGCERVFEDRTKGARSDRQGRAQALDWIRKGDLLVVWKLVRPGRILSQLVSTVRPLEEEGFGFCSPTEGVDTTNAGGTPVFHNFRALAGSSGISSGSGPWQAWPRRGRAAGREGSRAN